MKITNNNHKKNLSKNLKTPSLRDLMLGKKVVKSLPDNFFEKVLDLELKVKREFNMKILQELINFYSTAIEYYESKEDPKFRDYQNRLNILLSQPDILKKMNDINKVKPQITDSKEYIKHLKKEQEKKNIIAKVNYKNSNNTMANNEGKVQKLLNNIKDNNKIDNVLTKDLDNQKKTLKDRLEQRKNKKLLSTSDCTEAIETIKNNRMPKKIMNKSQIILNNNTSTSFNLKTYLGEEEKDDNKFDLDTSFEKLEYNGPEDNLINSEDLVNKSNNNLKRLASNIISPNESTSILGEYKGPKHKVLFNNMNSSISNFLEDFKLLFFDQIFVKFYKNLNELLEEKHNKRFEIYYKYQSQISEMELMMNDDDNHKESIKIIIENLEEERKEDINKLNNEYEDILNKKLSEFKEQNIKGCPSINNIENKFKIDMLNSVNEIIYPNSKK